VGLKSTPATEPATKRTPASSVTPTLLSIGELSDRTGVPTTTLRYYDELGLVRGQIKGRITIHEMRPTVMGRAHSEIRGKNLAERSVPWEQWLRGSALA
jgi:hypothetical protein